MNAIEIIEKGQVGLVGSGALLGLLLSWLLLSACAAGCKDGWMDLVRLWIERQPLPLQEFYCDVVIGFLTRRLKLRHYLEMRRVLLRHRFEMLALQMRYVVRVLAKEIGGLHRGNRDGNSGRKGNLGDEPSSAFFQLDDAKTVEQWNGHQHRNEQDVENDNGFAKRGHGHSSPNVQDEPRPWLARFVRLGARSVTAMVVGSSDWLGSVFNFCIENFINIRIGDFTLLQYG